jgi:hypothetical protein
VQVMSRRNFLLSLLRFFKSVHHRTIQTNHQPDATIFQFIFLTFIYSSCFGRFPAHHHELNACSGRLCFYLRIVVIVVLCSWSDRLWRIGVCSQECIVLLLTHSRFPVIGPTTNTAGLSSRYEGKTRGCHSRHWAPDDGRENARNMLGCK